MRKVAITLVIAGTLALSATGLGAVPQKGKFAGTTSARHINGFRDGVTFTATSTGKTLRNFTFGTLGCFGTGAFPVGVDPYAMASAVAKISAISLSPMGTFLLTTQPYFVDPEGITTTATVQGSFTSATAVKGTITITQAFKSDKCGPAKMTFTAAPGVPDDSNGP